MEKIEAGFQKISAEAVGGLISGPAGPSSPTSQASSPAPFYAMSSSISRTAFFSVALAKAAWGPGWRVSTR